MKYTSDNCAPPSFATDTDEKEIDLEWLLLISKAKELGISFAEIKEFLLNPDAFIRKDS